MPCKVEEGNEKLENNTGQDFNQKENIDNDINSNNTNSNYNNKKKVKGEKKEYTLEEIQELIKNTVVIPKDEWMKLEPGIFIS